MKKLRFVLAILTMGMLLSTGAAANGQADQGSSVVHPASAAQMIIVTLKNLRHWHGKDEEFVMAQAAGFSPGSPESGVRGWNDEAQTCDVITTFDVVKSYEERETWHTVKQRIEIVVNGQAYPAKFRELGFYPLGLNLACIDFESPIDRATSQLAALPLDQGTPGFSSLSYNETEIAKSDPGTPFLNERGEISSVLIATPNGPLEFASASDIRKFLEAASAVPVWPLLMHRTLASI